MHFRPLEDLRVSITGGVHFDLVKRVLRDINRSGQAPEEIIQQVFDSIWFDIFNVLGGNWDPTDRKSAQLILRL